MGKLYTSATDETEEYMPASIVYANRLTKRLAELRKYGHLGYLGPDGKAQVTVSYGDNGQPEEITAVVLSAQHEAEVNIEQLRNDLTGMIYDTLPRHLMKNAKIYINPTGRFVVGGPCGDSGLT